MLNIINQNSLLNLSFERFEESKFICNSCGCLLYDAFCKYHGNSNIEFYDEYLKHFCEVWDV
jgi:hypothetical protein